MSFSTVFGQAYFLSKRVKRRLLAWATKPLFLKCGHNLRFDPETSIFSHSLIQIGDDVMIGSRAMFISGISKITIGNKVLFGPNVTIRGGNHNFSELGRYIYDVREKKEGDDGPVTVCDDVWIGTNVTILCGVTIGRGSIVAAGSVVTRDVPAYSIVGGVPARLLRWRWSVDEVLKHEDALYPVEERLGRKNIEISRKTAQPSV